MRLAPWSLSAGVIAALLAGCSAPPRPARTPGPEPALRVMTYNVNFGIPGDGPTLAAIEAGNADVVFLQEINTGWERALRARFAAVVPAHGALSARRRGRHRRHVAAADPRAKADRPEGDGWFPALRLVLDSPLGPVQALVVHLRPPVSDGGSFVSGHFTAPAIHEKEITRFCQALDRNLPTMVVGDFNEEADGRAIAYLARAEWRMKSALPQFAPDRPTWRWPTTFHTFERQLDHIIYDVRLEPLSAEVIDAGRSDHFPVVGVFVLARPPA